MRYKRTDEGYQLYSVGYDMKDNDGNGKRRFYGSEGSEVHSQDIVFDTNR